MKTKIFYSNNEEAMNVWLAEHRSDIEVVGITRKHPKNPSGKTYLKVEEVTIYFKEKTDAKSS